MIEDLDQIKAEVLTLAEHVRWRLVMVANALRGGTEWAWKKFVELADWALLSEAKMALQGAV